MNDEEGHELYSGDRSEQDETTRIHEAVFPETLVRISCGIENRQMLTSAEVDKFGRDETEETMESMANLESSSKSPRSFFGAYLVHLGNCSVFLRVGYKKLEQWKLAKYVPALQPATSIGFTFHRCLRQVP